LCPFAQRRLRLISFKGGSIPGTQLDFVTPTHLPFTLGHRPMGLWETFGRERDSHNTVYRPSKFNRDQGERRAYIVRPHTTAQEGGIHFPPQTGTTGGGRNPQFLYWNREQNRGLINKILPRNQHVLVGAQHYYIYRRATGWGGTRPHHS